MSFIQLPTTTEVSMSQGKMVNRIGNNLKCIRNVGSYKIFIDHFMGNKHYYVLDINTEEVRYGGINRYCYLVQDLVEDETT